MEMLLIGVTLVSLALATSLAAVAWKLLRDHHRFAAARVEALVALATSGEAPEPDAPSTPSMPSTPIETPGARVLTFEPAGSSLDLPLVLPGQEPATAPIFAAAAAASESSGRRHALGWAMAGLMLAAGATALYAARASGSHFLSTVLRAASRAEAPAPPLELRVLQHAIDDRGTFVVSGVVADPPGGRTFQDVVAVVYLFDEDGTCFANGRAAIVTDELRAGGESAFEVRVAAKTPVTRYRVGFRLADGGTVAHVDRRSQ